MNEAREKIIEAMARAFSCCDCELCVRKAAAALAAIAEQGYAVVPREATEEMQLIGREACFAGNDPVPNEGACKTSFDAMTASADIARPDPADEAKL